MQTNASCCQDINVSLPPKQTTLADLLDGLARREQSALAAFYDQTHRLVFGLLLALLHEQSTAEAVLLDVYEHVWQYVKQAPKQSQPLLAWLMLLTRKLALERLSALSKAQDRHNDTPFELNNDATSFECDEVTERRQRVRRALLQLPAEQRHALELACFAGLTYIEIARHLGRAPEEIKAQLTAGMRLLKVHLRPQG